MRRKMSGTFWEIALNCLIYGALIQLVCVFIPYSLADLSLGLWIGVAIAIGMGAHMDMVIERSVSGLTEKQAMHLMRMNSMGRYFFVVLAFGLVLVYKIGNPLACFAGVMTLKVAAYTQPFTHKIIMKLKIKG